MTEFERMRLFNITKQIETVIENLSEAAERTDDSKTIDILWEQGVRLHSIKSDILKVRGRRQ